MHINRGVTLHPFATEIRRNKQMLFVLALKPKCWLSQTNFSPFIFQPDWPQAPLSTFKIKDCLAGAAGREEKRSGRRSMGRQKDKVVSKQDLILNRARPIYRGKLLLATLEWSEFQIVGHVPNKSERKCTKCSRARFPRFPPSSPHV